jgi:hypothetical protein
MVDAVYAEGALRSRREKVDIGRWTIIVVAAILAMGLCSCVTREKKSPPAGAVPARTQVLSPEPTGTLSRPETASSPALRLAGNMAFTAVDANRDGLNEALVVTVEVQTAVAGQYAVSGYLQKDGSLVANRPRFETALDSRAAFEDGAGTHAVDISFSGEQIFRSGEDGPYDLFLSVIGPDRAFARETFTTPAVVHTQYGEIPYRLTGASDSALDSDNDGDFDVVNLAVGVTVRVPGAFTLQGAVSDRDNTIAVASGEFEPGVGTHTVDLQIPASALRHAGEDGPYEATVSLIDASGHTLESILFTTQAYALDRFQAQPEGNGNLSEETQIDGRPG